MCKPLAAQAPIAESGQGTELCLKTFCGLKSNRRRVHQQHHIFSALQQRLQQLALCQLAAFRVTF